MGGFLPVRRGGEGSEGGWVIAAGAATGEPPERLGSEERGVSDRGGGWAPPRGPGRLLPRPSCGRGEGRRGGGAAAAVAGASARAGPCRGGGSPGAPCAAAPARSSRPSKPWRGGGGGCSGSCRCWLSSASSRWEPRPKVSVRPTASMHISSESVDNLKVQESAKSVKMEVRMEEEKTLNDLVGLLQDVVKNIPTKQAEAPLSTEASAIVIPNMEPSPSETDDTVWVSLTPKAGGMQMEPSQTVASTKTTLTTTAFWKLRKDASASVILHSDMTTSEKTTPENLKSETAASVLYSNNATPGKALVRVSLLMKTGTTTGKSKSFDQLTNGALASLVESLKNVKKIHMTLHKVSNKPQEGDNNGKVVEVHQHKPAVADILELIDTLIATIKNAPSSVKKDPALRKYIEKAESFLKNALELAAEAEKKLMQKNQKQENKLQPEIPPSPPTTVLVSEVTIQVTPSSTEPLTKKAEDAQVELGKLKAFINLLYGFSPHLTSYAQNSNSTGKKVAEDIVERAMAVLDAIKSIFCGNPEGRSKQVLKQLLKDDMELVRQAMNEKRVS